MLSFCVASRETDAGGRRSDLHEYLGGPIFPPKEGESNPWTGARLPTHLGHEMCGTIVELGSGVSGFSVGDRVCVNPAQHCGHHGMPYCGACRSGNHNICKRTAYYGLNSHGGGFSEDICVKPFALIPLPDNVSLRLAGLAEPLAVARHMIRVSDFEAGDNAVVLGAGPIGCAITYLLKALGAGTVIVSEIAASRAKQAASFGADKVVNPLDGPKLAAGGNEASAAVLAAVQGLTEEGVDVAFDCCGLQTTLDTAIASVRPGGVVFNVAIHEKPLKVHLNELTLSEKRLTGGICYTRQDFDDVVQVLSTNGAEAERLITSIIPLEQVIEGGFQELIKNTANHVKILVEVNGEGSSGGSRSRL